MDEGGKLETFEYKGGNYTNVNNWILSVNNNSLNRYWAFCHEITYKLDTVAKTITIESNNRIYSLLLATPISTGSDEINCNTHVLDISEFLDAGVTVCNSIFILAKSGLVGTPINNCLVALGVGNAFPSSSLVKKLQEGFFILAVMRSGPPYTTTINAPYYFKDGIKIFNQYIEKDDTSFNDIMSPLLSSKFIEKVEVFPVSAKATWNGFIFTISAIQDNTYAGLNFWVSKHDINCYYVIRVESSVYKNWGTVTPRITYGARKYWGDANIPSGITANEITTIVNDDGSLLIGVHLLNPDAVEDAVFRLMFWGAVDTMKVSSIKVYDKNSFKSALSSFGIIVQTAQTAFNGTKYKVLDYAASISSVTNIGSYTKSANNEYSLNASIISNSGNNFGNTAIGISLPEKKQYYIGVAVLDKNYDPNDPPVMRITGNDANDIITDHDKTYEVGDKYVRIVIVTPKIGLLGTLIYPRRMYFFGVGDKVFNFHIYDIKGWAIEGIMPDDFQGIVTSILETVQVGKALSSNSTISRSVLIADKLSDVVEVSNEVVKKLAIPPIPGIVCWGSSSTAGGGWVNALAELTGLRTFNGGIGGENLWTILGRIGSEPMRLNQPITIPAEVTPIQLGTGSSPSSSIFYVDGHKVTPLLQGNGLLNPVIIDGIEGTLKWTGTTYNDPNGIYTFTRAEAGKERTTLSDEIVYSYGSRTMRNCIQILLLGYNLGYASTAEYIEMVKRAKEFALNGMCLIVGRHSAGNKSAADTIISEEVEFKKEFGMMFVSSREYMVAHGLQEAGIEPTVQDEADIANGIIPSSLRADTAHFNTAGYAVYLNLIYRRLKELGYVS